MASGAATVRNLYTGGVSGNLYLDRRDFYLKPSQFAELFASVTPFLTRTMKANFRSGLTDPVFKLFEHRNPFERQVMSVSNDDDIQIAAASSGAGTESALIDFDTIIGLGSDIDASYEGLEFEVWSSDQLTLRGVVMCSEGTSSAGAKFRNLGTTQINTDNNDLFVCIGQATEEGVVAPAAWDDELQTVWNQTQIFRTPIEVTGTLRQAALRGATKDLARLRVQKAQEHKIQMERAFMFGASPLGTNLSGGDTFADLDLFIRATNGKPTRTTVGIVRAIRLYGASSGDNQSLFTVAEASYSFDNFIDDLEIVFQYVPNSGVKVGYAGAGAISYFSKKAMEKNAGWAIQISAEERDSSGMSIRKLITPHGDIDLIKSFSMNYEHKSQLLLVDERNLEYVQYRPSVFKANIKTDDGYDGTKDEYFSDAGLGITNIKAHQLFDIV